MKICISAESTCDLPKELLEKYDIHTIPFTIILGERNALDGEITSQEIVEFVNKTGTLPRTAAINEYDYEEYFKGLLKEGYDAVVHITLSSCISSANSQAQLAAKAVNENIYVIDSKSLSTGIALLAINGAKLRDKGESALDIYKNLCARVPYVQASFVLARLDYLYKGGRCSALTHFAAKALGIRPQILVKDGRMGPNKKYRGADLPVVKKYCIDTLNEFDNADKSLAFVTYTDFPDQNVIKECVDLLKEHGFKEVLTTHAGGTITSHCGERTIGILYMNDGDLQ